MNTVSVILDLIFLAIIVFCIWRGYKGGIILSVCAMVALLVAFIAADIVATVYSGEFDGAVNTFAGGMIDTASTETLQFKGFDEYGKPDERYNILSEQEKRDVYTVSVNTLKRVGVCDDLADQMAAETAEEINVVGQEMRKSLTVKLSSKTAFAAVFFVIFILVAIIFAAVGNIINLSFEIPGAQIVNRVVGAVLAVINGIVIVLFIACMFRYTGIVIGKSVVEGTKLVSKLVNSNIIANIFSL